jgi:plastocyanin
VKRLLISLAIAAVAASASAQEAEFTIVIRNHKFEPAELQVPAGQKIKLIVDNQDTTPEEFESHELNREKIVGGNSKISVYVGPLEAGRYPYFGEFHADTAQGALIAK